MRTFDPTSPRKNATVARAREFFEVLRRSGVIPFETPTPATTEEIRPFVDALREWEKL